MGPRDLSSADYELRVCLHDSGFHDSRLTSTNHGLQGCSVTQREGQGEGAELVFSRVSKKNICAAYTFRVHVASHVNTFRHPCHEM